MKLRQSIAATPDKVVLIPESETRRGQPQSTQEARVDDLVIGPRQAGKTTLVRAVFPEHRYCNLEHPEMRRLASEDPKQFFHLHKAPMILDEIQRVPEWLSWMLIRIKGDPSRKQLPPLYERDFGFRFQ